MPLGVPGYRRIAWAQRECGCYLMAVLACVCEAVWARRCGGCSRRYIAERFDCYFSYADFY